MTGARDQAEFSRTVRVDTLGSAPRTMTIAADADERAALARRFGLLALDRLEAEVDVSRAGGEGDVAVSGRLVADAVQPCAVSAEPVPEAIDTPFDLLFRPEQTGSGSADEELEIGADDLDVMFYDGALIDIGEAAAQTLALALDPYPRAAGAEQALADGLAGQPPAGAFRGLAALKDRLGG